MLGYVAEKKFHDTFLEHPEITEKGKDDDHDRKKKGDRRIVYKGKTLIIEVKSLQTAMVKKLGPDQWEGKSQVDGSDRRIIKFPDGSELNRGSGSNGTANRLKRSASPVAVSPIHAGIAFREAVAVVRLA